MVVILSSVSAEDGGLSALDDLSPSEQNFPSRDAAGLRYSTLISGDYNKDGKKHAHSSSCIKVLILDAEPLVQGKNLAERMCYIFCTDTKNDV